MIGWSWGISPIPGETERRARAVFGENNFYLRLGDRLPALLKEGGRALVTTFAPHSAFPELFYALVSTFQMAEELTDRQASDALRTRIDWQYALHLPPSFVTLREDDLCAFRQRLICDAALRGGFAELAKWLAELGGSRGLYAEKEALEMRVVVLCRINRMTWLLQAIGDLLGVLARVRGDWLKQVARAHWYSFYWSDHSQIAGLVADASDEEIAALGKRLGDDALHLLAAVDGLRDLDAAEMAGIRRLRRIWRQQFEEGRADDSRFMPFCRFCIQPSGAHLEEGT